MALDVNLLKVPALGPEQRLGRRLSRRDSEYLRNGTTNLFAALAVHCGTVASMTRSDAQPV